MFAKVLEFGTPSGRKQYKGEREMEVLTVGGGRGTEV